MSTIYPYTWRCLRRYCQPFPIEQAVARSVVELLLKFIEIYLANRRPCALSRVSELSCVSELSHVTAALDYGSLSVLN